MTHPTREYVINDSEISVYEYRQSEARRSPSATQEGGYDKELLYNFAKNGSPKGTIKHLEYIFDLSKYDNMLKENQIKNKIEKTFFSEILNPILKNKLNRDIIIKIHEQFNEKDKIIMIYEYLKRLSESLIYYLNKSAKVNPIYEIDLTKQITLGEYNKYLDWYRSYNTKIISEQATLTTINNTNHLPEAKKIQIISIDHYNTTLFMLKIRLNKIID